MGEKAGHPFRGNQWGSAAGGASGGAGASQEDDHDTLIKYQRDSFAMNAALRSGLSVDQLSEHQRKVVEVLDKAVKEHHLPEGVKLYRGIPKEFAPDFKVGSTVDDKAFVSTTKDRWTAQSFIEDSYGEGQAVVITIRMPQGGARGLDVNKKIPVEKNFYDDQHEVILPRGSRFHVESNQVHQGVQHIGVLLMP